MAPATCLLWGRRALCRCYPEPFGGGKALGPEALAALADELGDFESGHTRFPAHGGGGVRGARRSTARAARAHTRNTGYGRCDFASGHTTFPANGSRSSRPPSVTRGTGGVGSQHHSPVLRKSTRHAPNCCRIFFADEKMPPPRTLQGDYGQGPMFALG